MRSRVLWGLVALLAATAIVVVVPAFGAHAARQAQGKSSVPGNAVNGKKVFITYCGKCHTLAAAGSRGTLGNDLDHVNVSFSCVVSAIENGIGGIQAEYVLRNVSFQQVYDVAAYVSKVSTKTGNTPCLK